MNLETLVNASGNGSVLIGLKSVLVDGVAGLVGGGCCVAIGHPLDTAKVLMQAQSSTARSFGTAPTSTFGCLVSILRTRGVASGWYAGAGAALASNCAENSILFMSYGKISQATSSWLKEDAWFARGAVAGSISALVASLALCPIELVKVRVQAGDGATSAIQCAQQIVRQHGVGELFNGFSATILREVPGNVAFFGVYEYAVSKFRKHDMFGSDDLRVLTAGGLGGIGFWVVALPFDAIKTQQHLFRGSMMSVSQTIYQTQGLTGFYRGLMPCVVRAFPSNAALFWGVSKTTDFLNYIMN